MKLERQLNMKKNNMGKDPFFSSIAINSRVSITGNLVKELTQGDVIYKLLDGVTKTSQEIKKKNSLFPPAEFTVQLWDYLCHKRDFQPANGNYVRIALENDYYLKIDPTGGNRCQYTLVVNEAILEDKKILFELNMQLLLAYLFENKFRDQLTDGVVNFEAIDKILNQSSDYKEVSKKLLSLKMNSKSELAKIVFGLIQSGLGIDRPMNFTTFYFDKVGFVNLHDDLSDLFMPLNMNLILKNQNTQYAFNEKINYVSFIENLINGFSPFDSSDLRSVTTEENNSEKSNEKSDLILRIYHGPPGTGKTNVAKKAHVEILGSKEKQVSNSYIVQIHPSFGYEDLVEGIKPVTYFNGEIKYQVVDGPVKIMAKKALGTEPLGVLCCIKSGFIHMPFGTKARYQLNNVDVSVTNNKENCFALNTPLEGDYFKSEFDFKVDTEDKDKGVFKMLYFWEKSWNQSEPYVLVLDEINRGHVATILGELVFALSETASDDPQSVKLQYSGESFKWPMNLSLIATMNTADTTTDRIDQAIKRRFELVPVEPLVSYDDWCEQIKFMNYKDDGDVVQALEKLLGKSNDNYLLPWNTLTKINENLYKESCPKEDARAYGAITVKEKRIGHSYFIKYAREFLSNEKDHEDKKAFAQVILGKILEYEIYPSMLNIFNNNEEQFIKFKNEKLNFLNDIHLKFKNNISNIGEARAAKRQSEIKKDELLKRKAAAGE